MNMNMEVDPLSTYEYPYDYNNAHQNINPYAHLHPVKQEQPMFGHEFLGHFMDVSYKNNDRLYPNIPPIPHQQYPERQYTDLHTIGNENNGNINNENGNNDVQNSAPPPKEEDVKPIINPKKIKKEKGRKSSYFSEKILDDNFQFYGCSVCDISFAVLHDLDQHVTTHKDRITSYDLKIKNQIKRKNMKKELKKKKKMQKDVKVEGENQFEIEIKPEDGYIGNEKATDFNANQNENNGNTTNESNGNITNGNNGVTTNENNGNTPNENKGDSANTINENSATDNGNAPTDNDSKKDVRDKIESDKAKEQTDAERINLEKIYKCFACKKQFTLSYYLKLHVRSHTDEKPYTCSVCGQSFITASKLGRHNKRMHLSVRYQCRICYRFFSKFECLTRHFDKKHQDDKLEGEPYDYNAILPYLKELEEQLKEKAEEAKKAKSEDLWDGWPAPIENGETNDNTHSVLVEEKPIEGLVDEKPFSMLPDVSQIKKEEPYPEFAAVKDSDSLKSEKEDKDDLNDSFQDDFRDDDPKDDCFKNDDDGNVSDDNYFPTGTWVPPTPKVEIEDKPKRRKKTDPPLKCDICNKKISTITYMRIHMRTHTGERPFKCYICERGFITSSKLHRHVLTHAEAWEGEGGFKCYICERGFKTSSKLHRHVLTHAEAWEGEIVRFRIECDICNKKISTITYMRIHMRTHTGERPFKCYICEKGFITSSKLHRHVLTHAEAWEGEMDKDANVKEESEADIKEEGEGEGKKGKKRKNDKKIDKNNRITRAKAEFAAKTKGEAKKSRRWQHTCQFCHRRFLHAETLQVHKKSHAGEELVYKCHYCLLPQPDEATLTEHETTHTGPAPYVCTECGNKYRKREAMIYHKKQHKPDKLFYCEVCLKSFNAQCKLQRHLLSHSEKKFVLRYECPVCAHMFHTKYHIQMHLTTHQKEGLIQAENRNDILAMVLQNARKFPKQTDTPTSNLTDILPNDDRSRICNICGEIFQHFYYLEEHLKSHGSKIALDDINNEEEKKHICKVCNKGFKLHYYLKLHSFTHTKEKPFICQQCGKGFITRGKLKRHLETHTGIKKYQCHICCKFFTRTSYLRIHVRTIHGTQDYNFRLAKEYATPEGIVY